MTKLFKRIANKVKGIFSKDDFSAKGYQKIIKALKECNEEMGDMVDHYEGYVPVHDDTCTCHKCYEDNLDYVRRVEEERLRKEDEEAYAHVCKYGWIE